MRERPLRITVGPKGRKLFRVDRPTHPLVEQDNQAQADTDADAGTSVETETGRLWRLIWNKILCAAAEPERRRGVRHPAVSQEIWVGWSTRDQFQALDGLLINISRGGALIVLKTRPPRNRPVWVYKQVASNVWSVRGDVAGFTAAPGSAYAVRFRFAVPCPTPLCESAVCGEPSVPVPSPNAVRAVPEFRP